MRLKTTPAVLSLIILFAICVLPSAHASAQGGVGSGPFNIVVTAGNWDPLIIDVQFTQSGTPVGPLYNVMEEITLGTYKTIGTFTPGSDSNSLEIIYYFGGMTHVYIIPSDWAEKGLELNKSYTMISAIGEPLAYPLFESPVEGDTTIMVSSTEPPGVVCRGLTINTLLPNQTYPGMTFNVTVNWTAPVDDFNSIGLTDVAPDGWTVQADNSWCTPEASFNTSHGNKVEYAWADSYNISTPFLAMYKVTVPETADPGSNYWEVCANMSESWLEYYFGEEGPHTSCVSCESEMVITVPGYVTGETRDVNAQLLSDVEVLLKRGVGLPVTVRTDESTPDYSMICNNTGGDYWLRGVKDRYNTLDTRVIGAIVPHNVNLSEYIDWSTPELLAVGNVTDFEGDYGLVPMACDMSYALRSVNLWLFWPAANEEWGLSVWKAMQSVDSWQNPK